MKFTLPQELKSQAEGWFFSRWLDAASMADLDEFLTHLDYYVSLAHAEQVRKRRQVATISPLMAVVEKELKGRGIKLAEFAQEIGVSPQTVHNWKVRKIPGDKHLVVARYLGWTVEQLLEAA